MDVSFNLSLTGRPLLHWLYPKNLSVLERMGVAPLRAVNKTFRVGGEHKGLNVGDITAPWPRQDL